MPTFPPPKKVCVCLSSRKFVLVHLSEYADICQHEATCVPPVVRGGQATMRNKTREMDSSHVYLFDNCAVASLLDLLHSLSVATLTILFQVLPTADDKIGHLIGVGGNFSACFSLNWSKWQLLCLFSTPLACYYD